MADSPVDGSGAPGAAARTAAGGSTTGVRRNPVPSLLESLSRDHLDPGYAAAARRKAGTGGAPPDRNGGNGRLWKFLAVAAACVVVGLIFGVSAGSAESNEPRSEKARSALLEDIDRAEEQQSALATSAAELAEQLRVAQSELGVGGPMQTVAQLEQAGQITAVKGPGLRLILNEAPTTEGAAATGGVIQDRDVQLLVNDLWASGAEAISIGGVRLQPRSAIRTAGGSILVDNRPVFWPMAIEAIGDSSAMQVKLVRSSGYGRFTTWAQLYGIEFDVSAQSELNLPGGSSADLLFAGAPAESGSPKPSEPSTAPASATPTPTS